MDSAGGAVPEIPADVMPASPDESLASRYAHLSRFVNDIVLLMAEDGKILEANDRAVQAYGYSAGELLTLSIQDLLAASELPGCHQHFDHIIAYGSELFESKHRRKDGSVFDVEVSCRLVESQGRKLHQSIIRDIGERKQTEEKLRKATRAMRVLSASNQSLVRSIDEQSLLHAICRAATATGGYPLAWIGFAEEDQGKSVRVMAAAGHDLNYLNLIALSWGDQPSGRGPTGTCIRTGRVVIFNDFESNPNFEPWRERAENYGYRSAIALPLSCEGAVIGALSIYNSEPDAFQGQEVDLLQELAGDLSYGIQTHRQKLTQARIEEALLESALEFRTLFDKANDSIFIVDREGRFLEVNRMACERLGYSRAELMTMTVHNIDSPAFVAEKLAHLHHLEQEGKSLFETVHTAKNGAELPVEISNCLFEYRGTPAILCVARDISERKRLEAIARKQAADLERAKTAAENASRAKSQFVANVSHEIRTPMNGVLGMSTLLLDTPLNPEQRDYADIIRKSADALLGIVNDILDFSKIEAGRMKIEPVRFDLVEGLRVIGELLVPLLREKGLQYAFEPNVQHRWVTGDAGRIRQVILNLLWNAVKFTGQGHVKLRLTEAASAPAADGRTRFAIAVEDTGVGIAAQDLPLIFETFTQVDSSTTKKYKGTGLGLAISQRLAELMGGAITVNSELGKGSTFVFSVPLAVADAAEQKPDESRPARIVRRHRRVLLADDNSVNQKIGTRLLERCGCTVDLASDGKEALEMASRFRYDLILMDCGMPEMDGYEATRAIRSRELEGRHVPIVALTAHAVAESREVCLAAGMSDYISKPVSLQAIEQALSRWCP